MNMRLFAHGGAGIGLALALAACGGGGGGNGGNAATRINSSDFVMGSPDAPVEVVEFASVGCSHCAAFDRDVFPQFKAKYIDTGQVRYAMREMITGAPAYDVGGFLLARCAGKDRYYAVIEAVFRGQEQWMRQAQANQDPDFRTPLVQVALSAGMTEEQFNACVSDQKEVDAFNKRVEKNQKDAGAGNTPNFFFNGKHPYPPGELSMEQLEKAIADAKAGK
jgi:protein-disulfide isomerase